jgi:beta-lactamase class D
MKLLCALLALLVLAQAPSVRASGWEERPEVAELFRHAGVTGTFVLHDPLAQTFVGHDGERARDRYSPASTFKIPNTLIGLATGAVASVDQPLPYRGPPDPFIPAWARDMGLREAIALSNVPIYQELARRIGPEPMARHLARLEYGNGDIGGEVDRFWLEGPLRISALEQARFLARLAQEALPYAPELQRRVAEIVRVDQGGDWQLHAKTGWQNAPGAGVGWWVGWVRKGERVYAFALNMDMAGPADAGKRVELGRACLRALGLP